MATPSNPGGVNQEALDRIEERNREKRQRGTISTNYSRDRDGRDRSIRDRDIRDRDTRDRDTRDRDTRDKDSRRHSSWESPSPVIHNSDKQTPQRTPRSHREEPRSFRADETPGATPSYKYNSWADKRQPSNRGASSVSRRYEDEDERAFDREFYDADEDGARDEGFNPFQGDEEKFKKMEEELTKKQIQKLTARQRSANEGMYSSLVYFMYLFADLLLENVDNNRWEKNRLLTSGVVTQLEVDTDFDDDQEARVKLLVHNTKPPFLDGRIVFTKQQEPVMTVKDPTSDLAVISKKGKLNYLDSLIHFCRKSIIERGS